MGKTYGNCLRRSRAAVRVAAICAAMCAAMCAAAAAALFGCERSTPTNAGAQAAPAAGRDVVYTTFYPTTYFARRIADGMVPVVCPLPAGEDPIFWRPSRQIILEYQSAGLIVLNGASLERWVATASLPRSRVVDSAASLAGEFITYKTATHSHGPAGAHTHEGIDGHTWLDPQSARAQAVAILDAMVARWPEHADAFRAGARSLDADLADLDVRLRALSPRIERVRLLASHPAYNYVARRYGWRVTNLDLDPDATLDGEGLAQIERALEDGSGPAVLLWESEPLEATRAALRDRLGVVSVVFSPAESAPEAEGEGAADYLAIMRANVERLGAAIGG